MKALKFTLTFTGLVAPDGNDPEAHSIALTEHQLERHLDGIIRVATSQGLVTLESPATLEAYNHKTHISQAREREVEEHLQNPILIDRATAKSVIDHLQSKREESARQDLHSTVADLDKLLEQMQSATA